MNHDILVFISFAISTMADVFIAIGMFFLFRKIFRTKNLTLENNHEIFEHDKMLVNLQEQIEEIKHHE